MVGEFEDAVLLEGQHFVLRINPERLSCRHCGQAFALDVDLSVTVGHLATAHGQRVAERGA